MTEFESFTAEMAAGAELQWFHVNYGPLAEFAIKSYSAEYAFEDARAHLSDRNYKDLQLEGFLPCFYNAKPLEERLKQTFENAGDDGTPIKPLRLDIKMATIDVPISVLSDRKQHQLFSTKEFEVLPKHIDQEQAA